MGFKDGFAVLPLFHEVPERERRTLVAMLICVGCFFDHEPDAPTPRFALPLDQSYTAPLSEIGGRLALNETARTLVAIWCDLWSEPEVRDKLRIEHPADVSMLRRLLEAVGERPSVQVTLESLGIFRRPPGQIH